MVGAPNIENYCEPTTLVEAAQALSEGPATVVAGGTIVVREAQAGRLTYAPTLVNLQRVGDLRRIEQTADDLRIGALTRLRDLNENLGLREDAPILAETTRQMASAQVRNLGTIGGNLCWASASADLTLAFQLLDASVELVSWANGEITSRTLPLGEFLTGPEQTAREANEILTAIAVPRPALGLRAAFHKSGTRIALDTTIASVGVAAAVADGNITNVRIGFGGIAGTAVRAPRTEALVEGQILTESLADAAAEVARNEVDPPSDARASAWYRRELIATFTKRALNDLADA